MCVVGFVFPLSMKLIPICRAEATGDGLLGPLCLSEAIQTSDYSYFAPSVLATWAGPRHWKIHPKSADNGEWKGTLSWLP